MVRLPPALALFARGINLGQQSILTGLFMPPGNPDGSYKENDQTNDTAGMIKQVGKTGIFVAGWAIPIPVGT